MAAADWGTRPATADDLAWIARTLLTDLEHNSYFHGVPPRLVANMVDAIARQCQSDGWECLVAVPLAGADAELEFEDVPAGFAIYSPTPTMTVLAAVVDVGLRGLGVWRALRERIGLRDGQLVNVVLAGPAAMSLARKKYVAKHNWGRILEWLA